MAENWADSMAVALASKMVVPRAMHWVVLKVEKTAARVVVCSVAGSVDSMVLHLVAMMDFRTAELKAAEKAGTLEKPKAVVLAGRSVDPQAVELVFVKAVRWAQSMKAYSWAGPKVDHLDSRKAALWDAQMADDLVAVSAMTKVALTGNQKVVMMVEQLGGYWDKYLVACWVVQLVEHWVCARVGRKAKRWAGQLVDLWVTEMAVWMVAS